MANRAHLDDLGLSTGKKARLHRILFEHGLRNGTALFLPYDQGLEHGPADFFANPAACDPRYIIDLAVEGGFNGVVLQIGLAEKFYWEYAGEVPLVLKLNGKTEIPSDDAAALPGQRHASRRRSGSAPTPSATPSTSARPRRSRTSSSTATVREDARPVRHAADRVGLPARVGDRGQGRQGLVLRRRLRGPDRQRAGCRHRQGELPAPREAAHVREAGVRPGLLRPSRRSTPSFARRTARWC